MTTASASIADGLHLRNEVDRLKAHVHELLAASRAVREEQARIATYVASFVTHAQLDAALSTKISQSAAMAALVKQRGELLDEIARKADVESVAILQAKKLDASVFETSAWDLTKFRGVLEQTIRDMFSAFAAQTEAQVSSKLSIEDFNRIFNPETNGQRAAVENAATKIAHMTEQLEALQRYADDDQQRQLKVADMHVDLLDLTRKQTADRTALVQLGSAVATNSSQLSVLESSGAGKAIEMEVLADKLQELTKEQASTSQMHEEKLATIDQLLAQLQVRNDQAASGIAELKSFAHTTLIREFDGKLSNIHGGMQRRIEELGGKQRSATQHMTNELVRVNEKLLLHRDQAANLDETVRRLASNVKELHAGLADVRGPLVTLATNLKEENVAILTQINRSQDESREIMLDYRDLLEKEEQLQTPAPLHPTPTSVPRAASASYANRNGKSRKLLGVSARPHTSSPRVGAPTTTPTPPRSGSALASTRTISRDGGLLPRRVHTAGATKTITANSEAESSRIGATLPQNDADKRRVILARSSASMLDQDDMFHFPVESTSWCSLGGAVK